MKVLLEHSTGPGPEEAASAAKSDKAVAGSLRLQAAAIPFASGFYLGEPTQFAGRLHRAIKFGLNVDCGRNGRARARDSRFRGSRYLAVPEGRANGGSKAELGPVCCVIFKRGSLVDHFFGSRWVVGWVGRATRSIHIHCPWPDQFLGPGAVYTSAWPIFHYHYHKEEGKQEEEVEDPPPPSSPSPSYLW